MSQRLADSQVQTSAIPIPHQASGSSTSSTTNGPGTPSSRAKISSSKQASYNAARARRDRSVIMSESESEIEDSLTKQLDSDEYFDDSMKNVPPARAAKDKRPRESISSSRIHNAEAEALLSPASAPIDDAMPADYGALPEYVDEINLEDTFWFMKHRQWSRMYRSSYSNKQPRGYFSFRWSLFYLALYGTYLFLQLYVFKIGTVLEYILIGFISVSLGLWSPTVRWFLRLIALQFYAFFFIFCVMNMYNNPDLYIPLATALGGLAIITLIFWLIYPYVLRALSRCAGRVSPKIIIPDEEGGARCRYEIRQKAWFSDPYTCVYEGPLRKGRPHGWGVWIDTSFQGEFLTSYWYKGIPVGPFHSVENDTRNMLVNLRIIYASNSGGRWALTRTPLTMGVACIEACVSGSFFKGYPLVKMVSRPKECSCPKGRCSCISDIFRKKHYRHFDDERVLTSVTVTVDKKMKSLGVTGFKPRHGREQTVNISLESSESGLCLGVDEKWISSESREGLLFLHGMYHTLEDSLKRFGQFLALGHFPAHIKPLCFNWPSSAGPWLYWCAHNVASDNDNHRDFKRFLRSIKASGIRTLHIMCHSMGSRMFLRSFSTIKDLFKPRRLEADDHADSGLSSSGSRGLGTLAAAEAAVQPGSRGGYDDGLELQNLIFLNPDYEVETFRHDYDELVHFCPNITIYADRRDVALKLAFKINQKPSLGSNVDPLLDESGNSLDVDIVDTGDLDRNINGQFHGYFNINRVMVDDLYDLIVTGKRAEERTSRLKPRGKKVFRFTMVPSSVVVV